MLSKLSVLRCICNDAATKELYNVIADFQFLSLWTEPDSLTRAPSQSDAPLGPTPRPMCPYRLDSPLLFATSPEIQLVLSRSPGKVLLTVENIKLLRRSTEK